MNLCVCVSVSTESWTAHENARAAKKIPSGQRNSTVSWLLLLGVVAKFVFRIMCGMQNGCGMNYARLSQCYT